MSLLVDADRPVVTGPPIADGVTALYACYGILGALFERERSGIGRKVDLSMVESLMAFTHQAFGHYFVTGEVQGPTTRAQVAQAYVLSCADGKLVGMHLSSPDKEWQRLLNAIECVEIAQDPRFRTYAGRVQHYAILTQMLAKVFRARTREDWMDRLQENDVPFAPVYGSDEVVTDPHVRHLGTFYDVEGPQGETGKGDPAGRCLMMGIGDRTPWRRRHWVSTAAKVLGELGFSDEEMAELMRPSD